MAKFVKAPKGKSRLTKAQRGHQQAAYATATADGEFDREVYRAELDDKNVPYGKALKSLPYKYNVKTAA